MKQLNPALSTSFKIALTTLLLMLVVPVAFAAEAEEPVTLYGVGTLIFFMGIGAVALVGGVWLARERGEGTSND